MADPPTRQIPWLRVFVEGVVIVGSILLAFGIEAWWEGRQERVRESEILNALLPEFHNNRTLLLRYHADHESAVEAIEEVLTRLGAAQPDERVSIPDSLLVKALVASSFDSPSGALDAVLGSGDSQIIRNRALRELLAEWPSLVADATENTSALISIEIPKFFDTLVEDVNLTHALIGVARDVPSDGRTDVRATTEIMSRLASMMGWFSEAAREELVLLSRGDSVIALIEAELSN